MVIIHYLGLLRCFTVEYLFLEIAEKIKEIKKESPPFSRITE